MKNGRTLRTFYILIATQTFSLIGSQMTGLAVAIKVFKDTGQATPLAWTAFFAALPPLLWASLAGVLADRWDRRRVMALADAGQGVGTFLLLLSLASGRFELWHLYVVAAIQAFFGMFQGPAFEASITMLIPDKHRDRANAIQQMVGPMSGIIAPILAGLLFPLVHATGVMIIDLFTFAVAIVVVLLVHIPRPEQSAEGRAMRESIWKELTAGFRYLRTRQILFSMSIYVALMNFLLGGAFVLNTAYVLSITGSERTLGVLMGVTSAGAILGGIIMSIWGGTRPRIHTIMPGIAVCGVCLAVYGVARHPVTLGAALFTLLLPLPMINASFMSMMQIKVPPDLQGRVFALTGHLARIFQPIAFLAAGPLADRVAEPAVGGSGWSTVAPLVGSRAGSGIGLIMLFNGILITVVTLAVYALRPIRRMETILPDYVPAAAPEPEALPHSEPEPVPGRIEPAAV